MFNLAPTHVNYLQYNQFKMEQTAIVWPIGTHFNLFNLTVLHLKGIQALLAQSQSIKKLAFKYFVWFNSKGLSTKDIEN